MKEGYIYQFKNGNKFKVEYIKNNLCCCKVIDRYDTFYMLAKDGDYKIFIDELKELNPV